MIIIRDPKDPRVDELLRQLETHISIGNTLNDNTGIPSPLPPDPNSRIIAVDFDGNGGDELLMPPISPQPLTGGDYAGYKKIPLSLISKSGYLTETGDGGILVLEGGEGVYSMPHAWLDMSSDTNSNNVGFVFGLERGSDVFFSARFTGGRMANVNDRTNISGGNYITVLEGDKLYLWGCAELSSQVWIYDANLGFMFRNKIN